MSFTKIKQRLLRAARTLDLRPGDIYEDCFFHPVVCLGVDYKSDEIWGVSLIDGSYPRSCSLLHCGVRKLTPKQAWLIKRHGPEAADDRERIALQRRWWGKIPETEIYRVGRIGPARLPKSKSTTAVAPATATRKRSKAHRK
jgi:hypothetical protein